MGALVWILIWYGIGIASWILGAIFVDRNFAFRTIFESLLWGLLGIIIFGFMIFFLIEKMLSNEVVKEMFNRNLISRDYDKKS